MNQPYLILEIILKFHRGEPLTAEEEAVLEAWRERSETDAAEWMLLPPEEWPTEVAGSGEGVADEGRDEETDKIWERIQSEVTRLRPGVVVRPLRRRPWATRGAVAVAAAAAVILVFSVELYRYQRPRRAVAAPAPVARVWRAVAPGHFRSEWAGPQGIEVGDSAGSGKASPYPVVLPDGSTVTLSYKSSVHYIKEFGKTERRMMLTGQAHFDVAMEMRPFIVQSGKMTVQVLGTRFNWMHYPGMPDEITLMTGRIRVLLDDYQCELRPAERAVVHEGTKTKMQVKKMERPEASIAWMGKRPAMVFDSTDLFVVIQRMAEYYQVGFKVDPELQTGKPVTGIVDLERTLEENLAPIAFLVKDYAHVEKINGVIEVTD
jgi:ferric-dicitrate binding protein FerR (iron transport regulator)